MARDEAWMHGTRMERKNGSIRNYCGHEMKSGGVTRLKQHLAGNMNKSGDVISCLSVPPEVKDWVRSQLRQKDDAVKAKKTFDTKYT